MDDGCSPTVGILIFAGFVILDFVVFGFIAAMQNLNEAAIERLAGEEDGVPEIVGANRVKMHAKPKAA